MTALTWPNLEVPDAALAQVLYDHLGTAHERAVDEMGVPASELVLGTLDEAGLDRLIREHERLHPEDERAYDGEALPQRRELTAREREILCRTLHAAMYVMRSVKHTDLNVVAALPNGERTARWPDGQVVTPMRISGQADYDVLAECMRVLDPRRDS